MIELPKLEQIKQITRQSLRDTFPLYEESHLVDSSFLYNSREDIWISYKARERRGLHSMDSTHFDINIIKGIIFSDSLAIDREHRGKGIGWKLYETTHEVAKRLGFQSIRRSPSGWCFIDGKPTESRESYLLRRGYVSIGERLVEFRFT